MANRIRVCSEFYDGTWDESTRQNNIACAAMQSRRTKQRPFECNQGARNSSMKAHLQAKLERRRQQAQAPSHDPPRSATASGSSK